VRGEPPTMRRGRRTPRPQLPRLVQERPAHRVIVVTVASGEAGGDEGEVEDAEEEEGEQVCRVLILCHGTLLKCGRGLDPHVSSRALLQKILHGAGRARRRKETIYREVVKGIETNYLFNQWHMLGILL
jgi:hypothetical protein